MNAHVRPAALDVMTDELARQHAAHKARMARLNRRPAPQGKTEAEPVPATLDAIQDEARASAWPTDVRPVPMPAPMTTFAAVRRPTSLVPAEIIAALAETVTPETVIETRLTFAEIKRQVATKYGVSVDALTSARREQPLLLPRFECYWRARRETSLSLPQIGRMMGGRDHTSVLHGIRKYEAALADPALWAHYARWHPDLTPPEGMRG